MFFKNCNSLVSALHHRRIDSFQTGSILSMALLYHISFWRACMYCRRLQWSFVAVSGPLVENQLH